MRFGERRFDPDDPQQFRVYAAERRAGFPREVVFASLEEVRAEAARVMASRIWQRISRGTRQQGGQVEVRLGRGRNAKARLWNTRIIMPPALWRRDVLLHELAHCVRGPMTMNHGPQFTAAYLRLVHDCWSPELAERLREAFVVERVRVAPWGAAGARIPLPRADQMDAMRDEGAEQERLEREARLREELANFWRVYGELQAQGLVPLHPLATTAQS